MKVGRLMHLTTVYVCAKFHKNCPNSKKIVAIQSPLLPMFLDLENLQLLWAREQRNGRRQRAAGARSERATLAEGGSPDGPLSKIARKLFSVFTRFWPNLVYLLGVPVNDRPPTLKKIR